MEIRTCNGFLASELAGLPGLRQAEAGEFTRRAFANGRIDLVDAGFGDLVEVRAVEGDAPVRERHAQRGGALESVANAEGVPEGTPFFV